MGCAAAQVRKSINPATYEVIGAYADDGLEAAWAGIAAAKRAFQTSVWAIDHELRARVIGQISDAFVRELD
jgi:betaine-aldehyde dehydrogenase